VGNWNTLFLAETLKLAYLQPGTHLCISIYMCVYMGKGLNRQQFRGLAHTMTSML
jgi:hypothetical protein